ncbi:uncharacterized protein [Euwallacea similis]|uniref:uncharacterized protein n=1 Tax=Euwallacea similis TaxID=1736056 RepID=UPI00344F2293
MHKLHIILFNVMTQKLRGTKVEEREIIIKLHKKKKTCREIGETVGIPRSTIGKKNPRVNAPTLSTDRQRAPQVVVTAQTVRNFFKTKDYHRRIARKNHLLVKPIDKNECMAAGGVGNLAVINGIMDRFQYINILKSHLKPNAAKLNLGNN